MKLTKKFIYDTNELEECFKILTTMRKIFSTFSDTEDLLSQIVSIEELLLRLQEEPEFQETVPFNPNSPQLEEILVSSGKLTTTEIAQLINIPTRSVKLGLERGQIKPSQ